MDQISTKCDSQRTQKRLRSEETDKIEQCIVELQIAYDSAKEALSGLSKAFPKNENHLCDLELPINCFKEIAEKLPQDKNQMMKIGHMSDFKFQIFGSQFLTICKKQNMSVLEMGLAQTKEYVMTQLDFVLVIQVM